MSDQIKISVCITTRNRANFIGETLESIISQASDKVEIVILDGASSDNTTEVVNKYKQKFSNLNYFRAEKNSGVDRDMATCVERAHGEYCWLLSDDDWIKPGAINFILKEIESKCEIYLCNATRCNILMQPLSSNFWLSKNVKNKTFNLCNKEEFIEYCNLSKSIGALFSFWSTTIFRKEEWLKTGFIEEFDGSYYAMASTLLSFIKRKCRLRYIQKSLVLWRNEGITFSNEKGLVKRYLYDFDGYIRLAERYLNDDIDMKNAFLRVMTREHPWYTIIHVASYIDSRQQRMEFRNKMLKFGYNPIMISACYTLGRSRKFVSLGVTIKRKIVRNFPLQKIAEFFRQALKPGAYS